MRIRLKRVYELPSPVDGQRLLVDRYWPRGLTKAKVSVDEWLPDLAPSRELLRWFRSQPDQWNEFQRQYENELSSQSLVMNRVRELAAKQAVTLVYASKERVKFPARILIQHLISPDEAMQDPEVQRAYLRQIRRQSRYAQYAFTQLEDLEGVWEV